MSAARFGHFAFGLAVIVLVTACGGGGESPSPSPDATTSPAATSAATPAQTAASPEPAGTESAGPEPTTAATTAATPGEPVVLTVDSLAEVIVTDLVVRSEPGTGDDSIVYDNHLTEGDRLFVTMGPIEASGYDWYQVEPQQRPGSTVEDELPFGYVAAASREGEAWLRPLTLDCPSASLEALLDLDRHERLACFGATELTLQADSMSCGVQDPSGFIDPGWFENPICTVESDSSLSMRFPPEVSGGAPTGAVEITGHFDDARAQDCRWIGTEDAVFPEPPAAAVVLRCRLEFVVTSVTPAA